MRRPPPHSLPPLSLSPALFGSLKAPLPTSCFPSAVLHSERTSELSESPVSSPTRISPDPTGRGRPPTWASACLPRSLLSPTHCPLLCASRVALSASETCSSNSHFQNSLRSPAGLSNDPSSCFPSQKLVRVVSIHCFQPPARSHPPSNSKFSQTFHSDSLPSVPRTWPVSHHSPPCGKRKGRCSALRILAVEKARLPPPPNTWLRAPVPLAASWASLYLLWRLGPRLSSLLTPLSDSGTPLPP